MDSCINYKYIINMQTQELTTKVKSLLPEVIKAQEKLNAIDFDYGYYYNENYWECVFFFKNKLPITFKAQTQEELKLKLYEFYDL